MTCPTLWLVGTKNESVVPSVETYRAALDGTKVTLVIVDGLTHTDELDQIDRVFPSELAFMERYLSGR